MRGRGLKEKGEMVQQKKRRKGSDLLRKRGWVRGKQWGTGRENRGRMGMGKGGDKGANVGGLSRKRWEVGGGRGRTYNERGNSTKV